jgi:acetate---CoA ligase (ADP-forming)
MNVQTRSHRLAPLLTPRSIALVGASPKAGTVGNGMIRSITGGRYSGKLYLINPNYPEIEGRPCYAGLEDLPESVDHVVIGVANARIEAAVSAAIEAGARAATIFGSCYLPDDTDPPLTRRLAAMAKETGLVICGANGMGFYNFDYGLRVCGFPPPDWVQGGGGKALITHSGSVFSAFCHNDKRFVYNLAASPGQELGASADEYLDFALDLPTTRVVGLFIETVRNPEGFIAALAKADKRSIPVVALKVGRSAESAKLAVSHSGAVAGNHAAYEAVFDRHGVIAVETLDELANGLLLFGNDREVAAGGLASIHDSGGERELLVDQAVARGVPFARINVATTEKLRGRIDYGLEPINPLDAWGTGHDWEGIFEDCMAHLCDDPDTALGAMFAETRSGNMLHEGYSRGLKKVLARTAKPVIIVNNVAAVGDDSLVVRLTADNIPVLIGIDPALAVIRGAFERRDRRGRPPMAPVAAPAGARAKWASRLVAGRTLDEAESLALMADYGLPVLPHRIVESAAEARAAAAAIGWPVALKTAKPGLFHKSDAGGVRLGLQDAAALDAAYAEMAARLGPRMLVMQMVGKGIELSFGSVLDPQFGPLVMVGAGGVLIEMMKDRRFALPPFDAAEARRLIDRLALRALLDGKRGQPAADLAGLAGGFAAFAAMVADLGPLVAEIDINPVLATPKGTVALDALVVPAAGR